MKIVFVNTTKSGIPDGWWFGEPDDARKCDYLVEIRNKKPVAVYTFSKVSDKRVDGRFSFIGLEKVTTSIIKTEIIQRITIPTNVLNYQDI